MRPFILTPLSCFQGYKALFCVVLFMALMAQITIAKAEQVDTQTCQIKAIGGVPLQRLAVLAKGMNISRWFNAEPGKQPEVPSGSHLKQLRQLGITHIRLPIADELLSKKFKRTQSDSAFLTELDEAIELLLSMGFAVTIDMHPGKNFRDLHEAEPLAAFEMLKEVWEILAKRYKNTPPDKVFFELLNEPSLKQEQWHSQALRLIRMVRKIAPDHTLIYGTADKQQIHVLKKLVPFEVSNIIYAVHYYDPYVFTHQGRNWPKGHWLSHVKGLPFPAALDHPKVQTVLAQLKTKGHLKSIRTIEKSLDTPWSETRIANAFIELADWSRRNNRPVIMNEFGVLKHFTPLDDRRAWLKIVRTEAEKHCIGWTHWEFTKGFSLFNKQGDFDNNDVKAVTGTVLRP